MGRPFFCSTTIARERIRPPLTRSPILISTMSHPRSLLSIARSNIARSRSRRSRSSQNLMAQTCWAFNARLAPNFRPAFHGRRSLAAGSFSECPITLHLLATVGQVVIERRRARDEGLWPMAVYLLLGEQAGETDVPTNGPPATSCPKPAFSISIGMGGESHKAVLGANARVRQVQSVVVFQKEFSRTDLVCRANADVWLGRGGAAILFDSEFA